MNVLIYSVLLATALLVTGLLIYGGARGGIGSVAISPTVGIVLSAAALVLWGLLAVSSLDISTYSGGTEFTKSYEALAWLCVGGGAVAAASLFQASLETIRQTGGI